MSNQEQVELLLRGRDVWNEWRRQHPEANIDLSEDTLSFATFNGANLSGVHGRTSTYKPSSKFWREI